LAELAIFETSGTFCNPVAPNALPESRRLKGWYCGLVGLIIVFTAGLGAYAGIMGIW
jgi:hypothetical protein